MKKSRIVSLTLALTACTAGFTACTQKRPEAFVQGQGSELSALGEYDGKEFDLKTGGALGAAASSSADSVRIEANDKGVNNFPLVSYTTDAKLLGSVPFRGRENHVYRVRYQLTDNYLRILKVAPRADIPQEEYAYAEDLGSGRLAVPLVGYKISGYFRVENQTNEVGEKTRHLMEIQERDRSKASYVKVDFLSREVFESVKKVDVYPTSLFDGEWYYAETVIDTDDSQREDIGHSYQPVSRVAFRREQNQIRAVDATIDERLDRSNAVNLRTVLGIPAEYKEFRLKENSLKEEEVSEVQWSKRHWAKLDLTKMATYARVDKYGQPIGARDGGNTQISDLEISQDYLSFTVLWTADGMRTKHSFLKVGARDYEPRRYFRKDWNRFGYFAVEKPVLVDARLYSEDDWLKNVFVSRFNPKKDIEFRLPHGTSSRNRELAKTAIEYWDRAFQKAGAASRVKIAADPSQDVALGDLRYNVINFIDSVQSGGLLGYGPSVDDPMTGETISATTNIHVTPMRDSLIRSVRAYVLLKSGQLADRGVLNEEPSAPAAGANAAGKSETPATGSSKLKVFLPSAEKQGEFAEGELDVATLATQKNPGELDARQEFRLRQQHARARERLDEASPATDIDAQIAATCSEIAPYVEQRRKDPKLAEDYSILSGCADKLLDRKLLAVLIHELGHNFGLKHNFRGSTDKANFYTLEQATALDKDAGAYAATGRAPRASSVMDYSSGTADELVFPGTYDIAAIRFGYAGKVELKDGSIVDAPANAAAASKDLKPYLYCDDMDAYFLVDPLCMRFDEGTTPAEVAESLLRGLDDRVRYSAFRYGKYRPISSNDLAQRIVTYHLLPLKRLYDEWRFRLADVLGGSDADYLERTSPEGFADVLSQVRKLDPAQSGPAGLRALEYLPVGERIGAFFLDMIDLPNRYCVVSRKAADGGSLSDVVELEKVQVDVYRSAHFSIASCAEADAVGYFEANNLKLVREYGHFLNDLRLSTDPQDALDPVDALGMRVVRALSFQILSMRGTFSLTHWMRNVLPSILDEPTIRAATEKKLLDRVLKGVTLVERSKDEKGQVVEKTIVSERPRFEQERGLLSAFNRMHRMALPIPGKTSQSLERRKPFEVQINTSEAMVQMATVKVRVGPYWFAADAENTVAVQLIQKYISLAGKEKYKPDSKPLEEYRITLPVDEAAAQKLTVQEYLNQRAALSAFLEANPLYRELPSVKTLSTKMEKFLTDINAAIKPLKWTQEQVNNTIKLPIEQFAQQLAGEGKPVTIKLEVTQALLADSVKELDSVAKALIEDFQQNRSEYESQRDLIVNIMAGIQD